MTGEIEQLKQQRSNTKKNLSRIKNIIAAATSDERKQLSALELKCRLGIVESYYKQAVGLQIEIEKIQPDDAGREEIEEMYISVKCNIQALLGDDLNATFSENSMLSIVPNKLPPVRLPTFDEKFNHLVACLRGPALETVKAFQITNENYPKALARLKSRYDNNTLIFMENIALYSSLLSLGNDKAITHALLIHLTMSKVDDVSQRRWKESLDFTTLPTWTDCITFLERRCQYFESIDSGSSAKNDPRKFEIKKTKPKAIATQNSYKLSLSKSACYLCASTDHRIYKCPQLENMTPVERLEKVTSKGLCTNCLSKNHVIDKCTSSFKCKFCHLPHHTKLHDFSNTDVASDHNTSQRQVAAVHTHISKSCTGTIMLATASVFVRDATGGFQIGRALLDSCSQINVITDEFAQKLFLPRRRQHLQITSIGNSQSKIKQMTNSTIKSRFSNLEFTLDFCITSHIACQPDSDIDISSWNIPANINLSDEHFFKSRRVDLLLGTESFFNILSVGQIKLGPSLPTLQKTLLGWIVAGKVHCPPFVAVSSFHLSLEESINQSLEKLWKLEEIKFKTLSLTDEQQECELFYKQTVRQSLNGRVSIQLPFKENPCCLGDSRLNALKRFTTLERRFKHDPELKSKYIAFMSEYEELGHMSVVKTPDLTVPHFYIPHHCVFKLNSRTTKVRVVFDVSSTTSTNKSLNDILMVGATIQEELYLLLLKFRTFRFALTADIIKMYRQVLVDRNDRRFQYILWRNNEHDEVKTYELNTVTYGTAAAPFLAIRSLHYLADQYKLQFPIGANVIKSSFYVDDLICGADSIEHLEKIKFEVTEILNRGCMELTKWHSNNINMIEDSSVVSLNIDEGLLTSALGVSWNQAKDILFFEFRPKCKSRDAVSKRTILSIASSLFDPLGLMSPLIIGAKMLLQELWLLKLNWDESVPQNISTKWTTLLHDFKLVSSIEIPRLCLNPNAKSLQVHGFCDASIRAYGCCLYFRSKDANGNVTVHLFTAKSRVAPTKKRTLPQLELCGAQLLARLVEKVKGIWLNFDAEIFLWTDSQIVLHWLKQHSATLSTFIGNRISDIQDLTAHCVWRHVPSKSNPADIISRGSCVEELMQSIWFTGPLYLLLDEQKWPKNVLDNIDIDEVNKEKRKLAFCVEIRQNHVLASISAYSSYMKSLRIIAWMLRFYRQTNKKVSYKADTNTLSPQEIEQAMWCIVWNTQQQHFTQDIQCIKKKQVLKGPLKNLNPFLEHTSGFELLKVGGRLAHADIEMIQKYPVIMPSKCGFVQKYVRHLHLANYHAGPKALVALIRQRFWIVNVRKLTRQVVRSCVHCVRYRPKLLQQMMGNLPVERLTPSRPFARCAVDYCGPINTYLRIRGKAPYKTYICIFVCLATKAVHIEVVSDLSTDAFIAALKRFVGRRGLPTDLFCDNATNFVGANNKLKELKRFLFDSKNQLQLIKYCANEFINFRFIPPRAPHFGGLWEAAVKSAKGHLNRSVVNARLTYEELTTAMVEIEAVMNSRPISELSADPSDFEALTPAHFLTGSSLKSLPEREVIGQDLSHIERWRRITAIKNSFWKKWSQDYLNDLQVRTKWFSPHQNINKNSLVLISDDNAPPQRWSLGRIINLVPGQDGLIRVADIKTANGVIRRPIHKLALVPC